MNRIDRLMAILTTLQARRYTPATHLTETFSISQRTVYRDLSALAEIGIPVGHEPGKGYFVMPGYFLPPVSFSHEEANALVLVGSLADNFTDASVRQSYRSALDKIRAVLKGSQKEETEQLQSSIRVYAFPGIENSSHHLSVIQQAISRKTRLFMEYENSQQEKSRREVEPIGLTYYGMAWHLIAWCHNRQEYRDFKASRIISLRDTGLPFRKEEHPGIGEYIKMLENNH